MTPGISERSVSRRHLVTVVGSTGIGALAGCTLTTSDGEGGDEESRSIDEVDELTVATYDSFVDAPSSSPGPWIAETFEEEYEVSINWATPANGINHYIERRREESPIDADLFVGLNVDDLVTVDEGVDDPLFTSDGVDTVEGIDDVHDGLWFDPDERTIPYATNYISLVYDGTAIDAPSTFEELTEPAYRGDLITQNPADSTTGLAFLLHTVHHFGPDDYLAYWADLQENDVRVLGSWDAAYTSWSAGEAPMVVSYSTDQVFANMEGADLDQHQIRFIEGEGYANPEGAAVFATSDRGDAARTFIEFLLSPSVQGELAQLNVQFPATATADLPEDYDELAREPDVPVTFGYDELQESMNTWIDDWSRQFADV